MLLSALSILAAFTFLGIIEYISRTRQKIHSEVTRKIVHMTAGVVVATWPFYFKWWEIGLMSLAMLFVVAIVIQYKVFQSIHTVNRRSFGEILFAIAIGILAFFDGSHWIFAAAMLHLGLADGFAAVIGVKYGKRTHTQYKVFGNQKSLVGTLTFFVVSVIITSAYFAVTNTHDWQLFIAVPVITTLVENVAVYGTDNLLVPLVVAGLLKFF